MITFSYQNMNSDMKHFSAHILPTVLVVSIIILILVVLTFSLLDLNSLHYSHYHFSKQQKYHLDSAIELYCHDSLLLSSLEPDSSCQLYPDDHFSKVYYGMSQWGLYECLDVANYNKKISKKKLFGKHIENKFKASFWINNRNRALSISGQTKLEGKLYVPGGGINYINVNSSYYSGDLIPDSIIRVSENELPKLDSLNMMYIENLINQTSHKAFETLRKEDQLSNSFDNNARYLLAKDDLENIHLSGKLILVGNELTIFPSANIKDIILICSKVTIKEGFWGSLQIFARDSAIIENDVFLSFPSGIYIHGDSCQSYLRMGNHSSIDGYAIIMNKIENDELHSNFKMDANAMIRGLLYVDGSAEINGCVKGATYINDCFYKPNEEYFYAATLYDAKICRDDYFPYPLFFEGSYTRREIKLLH